MKNPIIIVVTIIVIVTILVLNLSISKPQAQTNSPLNLIQDNDIPTLDLTKANQTIEDEVRRRRRNQQRSKTTRIIPNDPRAIKENPNIKIVTIIDDRVGSSNPIPLSQSDLVLIGAVKESAAFLSADKSNMYSEFKIINERLINDKNSLGIQTGTEIEVTSNGGRIKFPSGHTQTYILEGQEYLKNGNSYILFIKNIAPFNDFELLTAYKIVGDRVFPTNESRRFTEFKGMPVQEFLNRLK